MMAKDSVKNRMEASGISFTEFTYQLAQGYDFYHLYTHNNCKIQMGGSDQWGNITTGTELIRRKAQGQAFAITAPLITKADGSKFGKSEGGNIWLDPERTSPYSFYQFWLNVGDEDAETFIKIYSLKSRTEIEELIANHKGNEYQRGLQKALAEEMTIRVHSEHDLTQAQKATQVFFKGTEEALRSLDLKTMDGAFADLDTFEISQKELKEGIGILDLVVTTTSIFPSKGEAKKMIAANGFSINKSKYTNVDGFINTDLLLHDKYMLLQKGKKQYFVLSVN